MVGLVIGNPLGIVGFSRIATRLGLAMLLPGVTWGGIFVVGAAGGIGFTIAIFTGDLAFADTMLPVAKLGVLIGAVAAMAIALGAGRVLLRKDGVDDRDQITLTDTESSALHTGPPAPMTKNPAGAWDSRCSPTECPIYNTQYSILDIGYSS